MVPEQIALTALEMWLFPNLEYGAERVAAVYHVSNPNSPAYIYHAALLYFNKAHTLRVALLSKPW